MTSNWHCEKFDWLDKLVEQDVICDETKSLIDIGLQGGGFVSGGFAKVVSSIVLCDLRILTPQDKERPYSGWYSAGLYALSALRGERTRHEERVKRYAWHKNDAPFDPFKIPRYMLLQGCGDIDVFFPTEESANLATKRARESHICEWTADTFAHNGHEFLTDGPKTSNIVQFISKFNGQPHDMLDTFDITNAKVYMDREGIHWCDDWAEVEDRHVLGISRTDRNNLIWRVAKWQRKHDFNGFRTGDDTKYVEALISLAEQSLDDKLVMWGKKVGIYSLRSHGQQLFKLMTPRALLTASMIYDNYTKTSILAKAIEKSNENRN